MMRKWMKIFAGTILSVSLLAGAVAFTACNGTSDSASTGNSASASVSDSTGSSEAQTNGYKVKVLYPDGKPVEGARVQFCTATNCLAETYLTGSDGTVFFPCDANVYDVHLVQGIPAGYEFDANAYKTPAAYGEVTVYLTAKAA